MSLRALDDALRQAEELGNLARGLELVAAALPGADAELRFHLRRLGRWILLRSPAARRRAVGLALPAELRAVAALQPGDEALAAAAVGVTEVLLLDAGGSGEAFVARLHAEAATAPGPSGPLGELCGHAERCLLRLLARRGRLPALGSSALRFGAPLALRRCGLSGRSAEAAAALALFSLWSGRPVPGGVLVSAALDEGGALLPVDGLEAKLRAAVRERPGLALFVRAPGCAPPATIDARLRQAASLEELLALVFGEDTLASLPALDLEGSVRLGLELYEKRGSFEAALEVLRAARELALARRAGAGEASAHRVEEFLCRWRAGSCLVHLGDPRGALEELEAARRLGDELWQAGELNPQPYFNARGSLAVLLRDLRRFDEAEALLLETLAGQRALRQDKRELAKTLGNLGELWTITGRFEEAGAALAEALSGLRAVYPEEVPRELCYLGNLALRRGDPERALALYDEGLEENRRVVRGQAANAAFLRYGRTRALLACGRPAEAVEAAEQTLAGLPVAQLYPRQLVLEQRGLAELALGWAAGEATLLAAADLSLARGALARFAAATALGELALHHLSAATGEERAAAWPLLERFVAASAELLDGLWGTGRAAALSRLLTAAPPGDTAACGAIAAEVRAACELLPY